MVSVRAQDPQHRPETMLKDTTLKYATTHDSRRFGQKTPRTTPSHPSKLPCNCPATPLPGNSEQPSGDPQKLRNLLTSAEPPRGPLEGPTDMSPQNRSPGPTSQRDLLPEDSTPGQKPRTTLGDMRIKNRRLKTSSPAPDAKPDDQPDANPITEPDAQPPAEDSKLSPPLPKITQTLHAGHAATMTTSTKATQKIIDKGAKPKIQVTLNGTTSPEAFTPNQQF